MISSSHSSEFATRMQERRLQRLYIFKKTFPHHPVNIWIITPFHRKFTKTPEDLCMAAFSSLKQSLTTGNER